MVYPRYIGLPNGLGLVWFGLVLGGGGREAQGVGESLENKGHEKVSSIQTHLIVLAS
jgi:hypothetical protein